LIPKSQEADALPAEDLEGEGQVERKVEERKPRGRVKPWLIPRYGASGETEEVKSINHECKITFPSAWN
jgi:hypothetical protein